MTFKVKYIIAIMHNLIANYIMLKRQYSCNNETAKLKKGKIENEKNELT